MATSTACLQVLALMAMLMAMTSGVYFKGAHSFGWGFGHHYGYHHGMRYGGIGLGHPAFVFPVMPISFGKSYPVSYGMGGYAGLGGFGRYAGYNTYNGYGYNPYNGYNLNYGYDDWDRYDDFDPFDGIDDFDFF